MKKFLSVFICVICHCDRKRGNLIRDCFVATLLAMTFLYNPCFAKLKPGDKAPGLILSHIADGRKISLTYLMQYNKPVVLSYFATWCKPCLQEIPELQKLQQQNPNVKIYLVNIDNLPKTKISEFLKQNNITLPVLLDPEAKITGESWEILKGGVASIPKLFLLSPTGVIKYISEGYEGGKGGKGNEDLTQKLTAKIAEIEADLQKKPKELTIFFTNSTNGFFESCDCPTHPYGGIVRRATYLKKQREKEFENLLLDSGDLLPPYCSDTLSEYLFKCYELLNYDAVGVGDQEISYKNFIKTFNNYKIPFLASNMNYCEGNVCKFLTPKEKLIEKAGLKIAVVSVTSPDVFALYPDEFLEKFPVLPIEDTISGFISQNKNNFDMLILISHSGFDIDKQIAQECPKIDVIIGGHSQTLLEKPVKIGETFIVQAGPDAQNIGKFVLKFDETKKIKSYDYEVTSLTKDIPDDPQIRTLINEYKQKIKK
ncbi:MAG: redoxin domain-containing protein [Elusimicrobia bacterium]|nr:redoxin domain-containing protein [Elusimicrobiota bacterium]